MGTMVLDENKVNSYVFTNLSKAKTAISSAYSAGLNLKNSLPSDFSYRTKTRNVVTEMNTLKSDISSIEQLLNFQITKIKSIEKNKSKYQSYFNFQIDMGITGAKTVQSPILEKSSTISETDSVKSSMNNTGATITNQNVGFFKGIFNDISNFFSDTGAKISDFVSSVFEKHKSAIDDIKEEISNTEVGKWVSNAVNDINDWKNETIDKIGNTEIGNKVFTVFNNAKDWTTEAINKVGAFISDTSMSVWNWITDVDNWKALGASIGNGILSFVKGVVSLVEAIGDFVLLVGGGISTIFYGAADIVSGIANGEWNWTYTKSLWNEVMSKVKYEWANELDNKVGARQFLDQYAFDAFKTEGMGCEISEGVGYIAGIIAITTLTCGAGSAVATINVGSASVTITSSSLVAGGTAAVAGTGKNVSAAWNDGASVLEGLGYGMTKGLYEGFEMTLGYAINSLKIFSGTGVLSQIGNSLSHVALDTIDGGSGGLVDPIFTMIYSPTDSNLEEIMRFVNYDKDGNQIYNKTWNDLTFAEKYQAIFEYKGGWSTVGSQALSAGCMSFLSEVPDITSVWKASNVVKKIGSGVDTYSEISKLKGKALTSAIEQVSESSNFKDVVNSIEPKKLLSALSDVDDNKIIANAISNITDTNKFKLVVSNMDSKKLAGTLPLLDDQTLKKIYSEIDTKHWINVLQECNVAEANRIMFITNSDTDIIRLNIADISVKKGIFTPILIQDLNNISTNDLLRLENPELIRVQIPGSNKIYTAMEIIEWNIGDYSYEKIFKLHDYKIKYDEYTKLISDSGIKSILDDIDAGKTVNMSVEEFNAYSKVRMLESDLKQIDFEIKQITSEIDVNLKLKYIDKILEYSDQNAANILRNNINSLLNSDIQSANEFMDRLIMIKQKYPNFNIEILESGTSCWNASLGTLFLNKNYTTDVLFHETGHALFDTLFDSIRPNNYDSIESIVRNRLYNNQDKCLSRLSSFLKMGNQDYDRIFNEQTIIFDSDIANIQSILKHIEDSYDNNINEIVNILKQCGLKESDAIDLLNSLSKQDAILKIYEQYRINEISIKTNKIFSSVGDSVGDSEVHDILSSLMDGGVIKIDNNESIFSHTKEYYKGYFDKNNIWHDYTFDEKQNLKFDEQIANFVSLKKLKCTYHLELLKDVLGEEWYNMMESMYKTITGG